MLPYYVMVLMPLTLSINAKKGRLGIQGNIRDKVSVYTIGSFFLVYFILLSLRDVSCGVDLKNYRYYFDNDIRTELSAIPQIYTIEVGFHVLNKLLSYISNDFQIYLTIIALICILPISILYYYESELPFLSIVFFITIFPFSMLFSGLRQSIALSFVPLAFFFVKKRKLVPYIVTVLFAVLFHQSALMLFLLYPVFRAKITKNWLYVVVPVMAIILLFNSRIYSVIVPLLGTRYYERYGVMTSTGAYTTILLLFALSLYSMVLPNSEKMDESAIGFRNLLFLSTCLQCFAPVNPMAMRMNYYYLLLVPIAITKVITNCKDKQKNIAFISYFVFIAVFLAYFYYSANYGADVLQIYPYVPFWKQ